jgi:hypothetical protein
MNHLVLGKAIGFCDILTLSSALSLSKELIFTPAEVKPIWAQLLRSLLNVTRRSGGGQDVALRHELLRMPPFEACFEASAFRQCTACWNEYRELDNTAESCRRHPGTRRARDPTSLEPSRMSCCNAFTGSPGCQPSRHFSRMPVCGVVSSRVDSDSVDSTCAICRRDLAATAAGLTQAISRAAPSADGATGLLPANTRGASVNAKSRRRQQRCSVTLRCSHAFCYGCISQWLLKSQSCPVCRQPCTQSYCDERLAEAEAEALEAGGSGGQEGHEGEGGVEHHSNCAAAAVAAAAARSKAHAAASGRGKPAAAPQRGGGRRRGRVQQSHLQVGGGGAGSAGSSSVTASKSRGKAAPAPSAAAAAAAAAAASRLAKQSTWTPTSRDLKPSPWRT